MNSLRYKLSTLVQTFWFIPAVLVVFSIVLAQFLIWLELRFGVPSQLSFIYQGGESGARSLLSSITTASIGVAGTMFSITIAALSSVVSTMGPRLLHSFLQDRGIKLTLGIFVATFAFALFSLRSISAGEEGENVFVPHYNVTVVMIYATLYIAAVVYYIGHMAGSISMTRVVNLLADDLSAALKKGTEEAAQQRQFTMPPEGYFLGGQPVYADRGGYVQYVDYQGLAKAAEKHESAIELLVRPGTHVTRGDLLAHCVPERFDIDEYVIIGNTRSDKQDMEFSVRQLLEVAVRALSPGTNDPFTAMDVTDRFAEVLSQLRDRALPQGVIERDQTIRVLYDVTTYEGLVDEMFVQIRQNAKGTVAVYMRMLEALSKVAASTTRPERCEVLQRHADLIISDARELVQTSSDLDSLERRHQALSQQLQHSAAQGEED
ncbi:DUF2254 domain-containing protein [Corynebacterium pelargi]|uniref:Uncharacterized protein n=1 Tax=Corynebacterium pelargi TaxID=1471400 RepID=A0A410W6S1_9CORY|nr:DUF2254 domain-containing protein [Corynebacterium pelargi]QAU51718.1 hypothetical protein CPELA_02100 [Corynebacterium pelargi]GGG80726.1 hypothetical protein GCM10007338_19130 [Corynebacterium pelargi]